MTAMLYPVSIDRAALEARFEIVGREATMTAILRSSRLPIPDVPSTVASDSNGMRVAWIGPRRMIVSSPIDKRARIGGALGAAVPACAAVALVDVTGSNATFVLRGNGSGEVLAQGVAHDLARLREKPGLIVATDGWGVATLIEHRNDCICVTVDATFGDYVEHVLRTAAGLPTSSKPGVMQAPPPPIRVSN